MHHELQGPDGHGHEKVIVVLSFQIEEEMIKGAPWEWNEACPEEGYQNISPAGAPHAEVPDARECCGIVYWRWWS